MSPPIHPSPQPPIVSIQPILSHKKGGFSPGAKKEALILLDPTTHTPINKDGLS